MGPLYLPDWTCCEQTLVQISAGIGREEVKAEGKEIAFQTVATSPSV